MNNNATIILNAITKWKQPHKKLIVGVDGYSGSGKTTLLKIINSEDILIVNRDDFAIPRKDFEAKFKNAKTDKEKANVMVNKTINVLELITFIAKYKKNKGVIRWTLREDISGQKNKIKQFDFSKQILIVEGIFLFSHNNLSNLFDKKIFVDVDQEIADKRRRKREQEKWGKDYFPDTHPDSYFKFIKIGFNNYLKERDPMGQVDLVIKSD